MKRDTLEVLYRQYAGELYLYALSLCKRPELAGELVSDAFFQALLSLDRSEITFKWWLFRLCPRLPN